MVIEHQKLRGDKCRGWHRHSVRQNATATGKAKGKTRLACAAADRHRGLPGERHILSRIGQRLDAVCGPHKSSRASFGFGVQPPVIPNPDRCRSAVPQIGKGLVRQRFAIRVWVGRRRGRLGRRWRWRGQGWGRGRRVRGVDHDRVFLFGADCEACAEDAFPRQVRKPALLVAAHGLMKRAVVAGVGNFDRRREDARCVGHDDAAVIRARAIAAVHFVRFQKAILPAASALGQWHVQDQIARLHTPAQLLRLVVHGGVAVLRVIKVAVDARHRSMKFQRRRSTRRRGGRRGGRRRKWWRVGRRRRSLRLGRN